MKKFQDFRKEMGWSSIEALGFLGSFWGEVIELAENGDVTGWTPEYVAELTGLKASPVRAWEALASTGWIDHKDGKVVIHDWLDAAATFLRGKYAKDNRERLVEIWALHGRTYGNPIGNLLGTACTVPNQTLPTKPTITPPPEGAFDLIWEKYPRQEGRRAAMRHFNASVLTFQHWLDIQIALKNYIAKIRRENIKDEFVLHGKTWFFNWRDYVEYKGTVLPQVPRPKAKSHVLPPEPEYTQADHDERHWESIDALSHGICPVPNCEQCARRKKPEQN